MDKINGYSADEAAELVDYISEGKKKGKTLSGLFEQYALKTGRAKGSVRNYYYALLRTTGDGRVTKLLNGKNLKAEKIVPFSEEETDRILREILIQKSKGVSVRRAVLKLADGDDKLMLRYQNKYRNVAAKEPQRLQRLMYECGFGREEMRKRVEEEINTLYDSLASSLKEENKRLTEIIKKLTDENALLRLQLRNN